MREDLMKRNNGSRRSTHPNGLKENTSQLIQIASPTVIVQLFNWLIVTETAAVVGRHLGNTELAAFSLATMTGNISCLAIILGTMSASDTLSPRAFGSGNYAEVGRLAVRAFLLCLIALVPSLIAICCYIEPILLAMGQDEVVVELIPSWMYFYAASVPFILLHRVVQRFLTCQGIVMPMMRVNAIVALIIHPLNLYFFVPQYGFVGSAIAWVLTRALQVLVLILLLCVERPHHPETWPALAELLSSGQYWKDVLRFQDVVEFIRLSIGGIMTFSEW